MFRETSDWKTIFEHPGPAYGRIREFFDYVVENCCGHAGRYGWLITNTTVEMAPHDSEIRYLLALHYRDLGEILVKEIERLKREDTKKGDLDGRITARLLITTIQGLRVTAKTEPAIESVREIANFLLFLTLPDPSRQSQPFPSTASPTD